MFLLSTGVTLQQCHVGGEKKKEPVSFAFDCVPDDRNGLNGSNGPGGILYEISMNKNYFDSFPLNVYLLFPPCSFLLQLYAYILYVPDDRSGSNGSNGPGDTRYVPDDRSGSKDSNGPNCLIGAAYQSDPLGPSDSNDSGGPVGSDGRLIGPKHPARFCGPSESSSPSDPSSHLADKCPLPLIGLSRPKGLFDQTNVVGSLPRNP